MKKLLAGYSPRGRSDEWTDVEKQFHEHIGRIRNGFWLCHKQFNSNASVYHGSSENLPESLGEFDVFTVISSRPTNQ